MKRFYTGLLLILALMIWTLPAQAASQYLISQTSPTAPSQFDMGSTQTVTYNVTNNSNGTNVGERIYEMRFRLNSGTVFSSATAAPVGWTRTAFSTTSVTLRANDWTTSIPSGSSLSFSVVMVMRTTSADVSDTLRDARARFTTDTNFSNGITLAGSFTNSVAAWTLKSLQVTSFQTVDIVTGLPVSTITAGQSFRLVMTVRNISSAAQSNIISAPNPPTTIETGTVTQVVTSTVYSPNPLTLAAGASGTITFTYTTAATDSGTITFSANARNGTNSATSRTAVSNLLTVSAGLFIANVSALPLCAYSGQTFTVSMSLTNSNLYGITGIVPTLAPTVGGIVTLTTGPVPATVSISASTTLPTAFTWTYTITGGTAGQTLQFTGSATGTASLPGSGAKTTPVATSPSVKRGGFSATINPTVTNADSTNAEVTLGITHNGCPLDSVRSVSIAIPGGWTYGGDGYASSDENWNPPAGTGPVVFTAPVAGTYDIPLGGSGSYSLVLSTPTTAGSSSFTLEIRNPAGAIIATETTPLITINPFNSGTPNFNLTVPGAWREQFR